MRTTKRNIWISVGAIIFLVVACMYFWRVYRVNHSTLTNLAPRVQEYSMNQDIPLPSGFYNRGYLDLTGYHVQVTNSVLCRVNELDKAGFISQEEQDLLLSLTANEWIIIVSATFHFEGDTDPLSGVIDMSDYQIVGPDYCFSCSTELNEFALFNKQLAGSSAFSITSGKDIYVQIPFFVDTQSVHAVEPEYILNQGIRLLLSRYPIEMYVKLEV